MPIKTGCKFMKKSLTFVLMFVMASALLVGISFGTDDERFEFSDLTVKDKKTGLMWTRNANIAGKYLTWKEALKFIENLNKQKYAGYSDWKLPTKEKSETLISYAISQGYERHIHEAFNEIGFINIQSFKYWSSTEYLGIPGGRWGIDMKVNYMVLIFKEDNLAVWPMRDDSMVSGEDKGAIIERFEFSDLTVKDKKTGLIWLKNVVIGNRYMTWLDAFKFIEQLNKEKHAGYSDWRLPTKVEFQSLIDFARSQEYAAGFNELLNKIGFGNVEGYNYWSSMAVIDDTTDAWSVNMYNGKKSANHKSSSFYVWPVRAGK